MGFCLGIIQKNYGNIGIYMFGASNMDLPESIKFYQESSPNPSTLAEQARDVWYIPLSSPV